MRRFVAIALIAQYMVAGAQWVEARMNPHPARWIAAGLAIVAATGLGSLAWGYPFLTTHTAHLTLPVVGVATGIMKAKEADKVA